jgi:Icc protein
MLRHAEPGGLVQQKSIGLGDWRILLLDSHVEGEVYGRIADPEMLFLEKELNDCTEANVLIALHHHPLPVDSAWMDELDVKNSALLLNSLSKSPRVRGVVFGHVHQEVDQQRDGIRLLGSPSSSFQFRPASREFDVDDTLPGYRWLRLEDDGSIATGISRLNDSRFRSVNRAGNT